MTKNSTKARLKRTRSQMKKQKRLQHFNSSAKLAHRHNIEGWDDSASLQQNYKKLGIVIDPNSSRDFAIARRVKPGSAPVQEAEFEGILTARLEAIKNMPKKAPYVVKSMDLDEQYRLQDLIRKHGYNFEAMARDIKVNIYQQTARQLEKRIEVLERILSNAAAEAEAKDDDADGEEHDSDFETDDEEDGEQEAEEEEEEEEVQQKTTGKKKAITRIPSEEGKSRTAANVSTVVMKKTLNKIDDFYKKLPQPSRKEVQVDARTVGVSGDKLVKKGKFYQTEPALAVKVQKGKAYTVVPPKLGRVLPNPELGEVGLKHYPGA